MNKKYWNTVFINESIPDGLLKEMIDDSYQLVTDGLPKNRKEKLK
jgi:predicted DNA-binding protein (MmcQ/YjbR family)